MDNNGYDNAYGAPQQPMQGQPAQPQQPYAQQPAMAGPYDTTMVGGSGGGKRRLTWLWITLGVLIVLVIATVVMWQLGVFGSLQQGNAGVWAAYDFVNEQIEMQKTMMGTNQTELGERLMNEPFEIDAEVAIESEMLSQMGIPMNGITLDVSAKYDMEDLGAKLSLMGMFEVGAYLIEDDFVVDVFGEASSIPIDLPIEADLGDVMPLKDRMMAFLPFLPEDDKMAKELFMLFAQSVPSQYTAMDTAYVYSPLDADEVQVKAITTQLDENALKEVAENYLTLLGQDDALKAEMQTFLDDFTEFFDLEDVNIDEELSDLDLSEMEEMDAAVFSWSVYERNGKYIGMGVNLVMEDTTADFDYMIEYEGNEAYYSSIVMNDGVETQNTVGHNTWNGDVMEYEQEATVTVVDYETGEQTTSTVSLFGTSEVDKKGSDEYEMNMEYSMNMDVPDMQTGSDFGMMMPGLPEELEFDFIIEAECLLGDDLEKLEDSREWDDIYNKEWGEFDDMNSSMFDFTL